MHHLRNAGPAEWSTFPEQAEAQLQINFNARPNAIAQTLILRQADVKQNWDVLINDKDLGNLIIDEQDLTTHINIPVNTLRDGENTLLIRSIAKVPDDIHVGEISLDRRSLYNVVTEANLDITVTDRTNAAMPARITILTEKRSLAMVVTRPGEKVTRRSGTVYTANGKASLRLPAGKYIVFASRGFEYNVDSLKVELNAGDRLQRSLYLKREVETTGWVSCDPHVHTFTHSKHGDATEEERALTLAGEGVELPVITDHNVYVDLNAAATAQEVRQHFTPVTGDELTTQIGHFNVFRTTPGSPVIDHQADTWTALSEKIGNKDNSKVVILNHARDIHNDFRPFDPSRHIASAGTSRDEWVFPANAMEVLNSGSQQTDHMRLFHDWFGMLNRGYNLTPVGSSDSHDVLRYTVGQGRTYIQAVDTDPGKIDVGKAIQNFRDGRVMVSAGLMTKMTANSKHGSDHGPGELVPAERNVHVKIEVWGPSWTSAHHVTLFMNGKKVREHKIDQGKKEPLKWKGTWDIQLPAHDVFLVAIAEGPGGGMPWWPIAKPYQPASPAWTPHVIGSSGAIWIDGNNNGKRESAYDYANEIYESVKGDPGKIVKSLAAYDESVAIQAAALLWKNGKELGSTAITRALKSADAHVKAGFEVVVSEAALIR